MIADERGLSNGRVFLNNGSVGLHAGQRHGRKPLARIQGGTVYVIKERMFALGEDSDITDESGRLAFHVDGKAFSLHDRLVVEDPTGREVAQIRRRPVSLTPTYHISRNGEDIAELHAKVLALFGPRFTLDVAGAGEIDVRGDFSAHEFTMVSDGQVVATVSKRWLSMGDTYAVDVAPGEDVLLLLAAVLAMDLAVDHMRAHR